MNGFNRKVLAGTVAAAALHGPALAQPQAVAAQEADIRAFIADVARQTGRTFIVDPRVRGTVTIYSDGEPLSESQTYELFLATLQANGLVATPGAGGATIIRPAEALSQQPSVGAGGSIATEVFRLRRLDAATAWEALRPFVGQQGQIIAAPGSNAVIIADYRDNLRRLRSILAEIDRDDAATETITLRNSSAEEMASIVGRLVNTAAQPAAGARSALTVIPVASSNSLILRGDPELVARSIAMVQDLDARAASAADVRVVRLQHADAAQILPVLQEVVGQQAAAPGADGAPAAAQPGSNVRISRFAGGNALVISADADTQRTLAEVIRALDVRRPQVLVEAIVVEISDSAARELGVQFLLAGREGSGVPFAATNFSSNAPNVLAITGAVLGDEVAPEDSETLDFLREAALTSLLGPFGGAIGFGGNIDDALFSVIVNAVKRDQASNILSTPSVMTLDNQEASILVGSEVPISTGSVLSDTNTNPFVTIERREIGVRLAVRPQINSGGAITLFLKQEVSSLDGVSTAAFSEPVFSTREIETTVLVDDGEIVALGGLLDETETVDEERVPLLGDIPFLGKLFRNKARGRDRTNLMVFIRPRIVSSAEDARAIAGPLYSSLRDTQRAQSRQGVSSLESIVRDYLRATPPDEPRTIPVPPPAEYERPPAGPEAGAAPTPQAEIGPAAQEPAAFRPDLQGAARLGPARSLVGPDAVAPVAASLAVPAQAASLEGFAAGPVETGFAAAALLAERAAGACGSVSYRAAGAAAFCGPEQAAATVAAAPPRRRFLGPPV